MFSTSVEFQADLSSRSPDYAQLEFAVLRDGGQVRSKVRPLSFRKVNFQPLKENGQ